MEKWIAQVTFRISAIAIMDGKEKTATYLLRMLAHPRNQEDFVTATESVQAVTEHAIAIVGGLALPARCHQEMGQCVQVASIQKHSLQGSALGVVMGFVELTAAVSVNMVGVASAVIKNWGNVESAPLGDIAKKVTH